MNAEDERRDSICRNCPERRTQGGYRWCAQDETGLERGECAKSRNARFNARLTMVPGTCDRWGGTAAICLPEVRTLVYTCAKPHCVARHPRVTQLLERLGFADWRFHWGPSGEPYWQAIRPDYVALLRDNDPPLLILEDDIAVRTFRPWIAPPPGAQLVYLGGGGSWRGSRLVADARAHLPQHTIRRVGNIGWEELVEYPDWVRVFGMFGTHACLWLDKAMMLEAADAMESDPVQTDVVLGKNQWRWFCALLRVPMFYQADGHNNAGTFDYGPKPPVTREQRRAVALAARGR